MLSTAKGETAPLTSDGDDWYLKVLINNRNEFPRIDVWTPCHVCPSSWVRIVSPEMKQRERYIAREQTGRKDYENSRKSMLLNLNFSLTGTWEIQVLRSLSILNPEEMDDTELLQGRLGTCCSMIVNTQPKAHTLLQRRRQSRMTPRVATRTSHLVSAKRQ